MLYVPIKIYPNQRSVRGCIAMAALCLGLAMAGFNFIENNNLRVAVYSISMVGFAVSIINSVAAMARRPMIKILDDRFSVYTPFGYAVVRFGEVLAFRRGRIPFLRTLRIDINKSARPQFASSLGRLLYSIIWLNFTNTVCIRGFLLGADTNAVMLMLEKRRLSAVRLEAIGDYNPTALTTTVG